MKQLSALPLALALAVCAAAAGCGPKRMAAATQPTPAAFDASKSDPKALAIVDAMTTAIGGAAAWDGVKQITWEFKYTDKGEVKSWFRHAWDRWNGRHHFEPVDPATGDSPYMVMYDVFETDSQGYAGDGRAPLMGADRDKAVALARARLQEEGYLLTAIHKLKDPGVSLQYTGQAPENILDSGQCKPQCDQIKVSFDPAVGKDTYYVYVNTESKMPEVLRRESPEARFALALTDWTTVAGLKFATKLTNIAGPNEVFQIADLEIGEPDDSLYIPPVQ
jgi:hypothetical protein